MLKSVRVKRILTAVLSVVVVAAMVVAGALFSDTDKSKSDILDNFEFVKLSATANPSVTDGVFSVEVTQDEVNKIVVKGTVDKTACPGEIFFRVGTDIIYSQIFSVFPDENGYFETEYDINKTFAKEYANELPVFICYNGNTELFVGTVGVITYDAQSGILGYPEGTYYISNEEQIALTTPYAPEDARKAGKILVAYGTSLLEFDVNSQKVAEAPEKGNDGVYEQYDVEGSITACLKTTAGREYAVVLIGGSIGNDYGISDDAWISADEATEIADLIPGAKYSAWVRVEGGNGTLPSAPVYLGEFVAMDAGDLAAKAAFLAKYEEITVTNGHKLYDSVDHTVTATPAEIEQLITLYNNVPDEYKAYEFAEKGKYLLISNYLANHQNVINAAKTAAKYDDLCANYSYADMMAALNDFNAIYDELGEAYLGNEADAEFIVDLAYTIAKIDVLSDVDVNDAAKDKKYEVVHYLYESIDNDRATAEERYESAEFLIGIFEMYRDEYEIGLFVKKYDIIKIDDLGAIDIPTLKAMLVDIEAVEVFGENGFGVGFVEEMSVDIYNKIKDKVKADLVADVAAKKESGKYDNNGLKKLDAKLAVAIGNLDNLDYAAGKRIADLEATFTTALEDIASVNIVILVVGNGAEYANENPAELNVKVLNYKGMNSALTISIKLAEGKDEIATDNVTVATGEFDDELADAAVNGKKVLFGFNITTTNAKIDDGYYTVKILLPKSYRTESGLQVVSESGETVYIYESAKGGAYLIFKTATLDGVYYILADKEVSLTWLIVLLAVLVVVEIAVVVYFIIRKKRFVAVFVPFLALLFPAGVIPAVIALGAVATVGAVGSSVFAVKTIKDEKKAKAEKAAEAPVEEVVEEAPVEEVVEEAPVEEVVEEAPVEEVVEEAPVEEVIEEAPVEEVVEEAPVEEVVEEAPVEEVIEEAPVEEVVEEAPVEEVIEEAPVEEVIEEAPVEEVVEETKISYNYSFRSKLMLAVPEGQSRYALISNTLLSYGIKSTESWSKERYFLKGKTYANLTFRGKTLCVYLAIAPATLEGTKYFFENVGGVKKYADIPVMVRVRSARGCKYVLELIKMMCEGAGLVQKKSVSNEFKYKSATLNEIIEMGYIKIVKNAKKGTFNPESVKKNKGVTVEEAENSDVEESVVIENVETVGENKGVVYIDSISDAFNDGDVVTVEALIEKNLVLEGVDYVKVLARGAINKRLTVEVHEFGTNAAKMIVMAGGTAVQLKK